MSNIKGEIMLEVKNLGLKIRFNRGKMIHPRLKEMRLCYECILEKWIRENNISGHTKISAVSYLNPIDTNDKIIGKKIALQKAIKETGNYFIKSDRTLIWRTFWKWIKQTHKV